MTFTLKNTLMRGLESPLMIGLASLLLVACGGGGGGAASETQDTSEPRSFAPDSERLVQTANNSNELYVEEDFSFSHAKLTQLRVLLSDDAGEALAHARVKVYLIDTADLETVPDEWNDELNAHAHVMAGGLSNAHGEFVRVLEFPNTHGHPLIMVEVNALGIENKKLVEVNSHYTALSFGLI